MSVDDLPKLPRVWVEERFVSKTAFFWAIVVGVGGILLTWVVIFIVWTDAKKVPGISELRQDIRALQTLIMRADSRIRQESNQAVQVGQIHEVPADEYLSTGQYADLPGVAWTSRTIRNHCENGMIVGAFKSESGRWQIPNPYFGKIPKVAENFRSAE